ALAPFDDAQMGLRLGGGGALLRLQLRSTLHHAAILGRNDFDEAREVEVPVLEDAGPELAAGVLDVRFDEAAQQVDVGFVDDAFEADHAGVAALAELAVLVEDERIAAAHARGEVAPGSPEHHDDAAGHVFAAVVADAFDDRPSAAVADREALA